MPASEDPTIDSPNPPSAAHHQLTTPESIGPYRVLSLLGEGGFGAVYVAEQSHPVRRRIAVKVIKAGMDTRAVLARFEAERQALAVMDHPSIAKVLDAGATETGRPYFAMELVKGEPITEYCNRHTLDIPKRINLFIQVAHAIQHAHQKGIIHRDLKPSNILVTLVDGHPIPKIIDFGIAKATTTPLTEHTIYTREGQLIGTPEYMSPEQAEMSGLDIDTRTDVYSLGVLLYELLTGTLPFDSSALRKASSAEIQRIIRETEPAKPSTRLSSLHDQSAPSPTHDNRALARRLRGDLDWIVLMAMEKDRTRRYPTADALADDLARFLNHEPVLAGPPSALYKIRKFSRRNRPFIIAVAAVTFALIAGIAATSIALLQVSTERDAANRAREESDAVTEFLAETLAAVDPAEQGKDVTVRAVLEQAAENIDDQFPDQPVIRARILHTVGRTLRELGAYEQAAPHLRRALDLSTRHLGPDNPKTIDAAYDLGWLHWTLAQFDKAEPLYRQVLEKRRRILGENHPDTLTALSGLALLLKSQGQLEDAEPLYLEALERYRSTRGDDDPGTLITMTNLAQLYSESDQLDKAEDLLLKALPLQRKALGEGHPDTITSMNNLARLYLSQDRVEEARDLYETVIDTIRRVLPARHWWLGPSLANHARCLMALEQYDEAEDDLLEAHAILLETFGQGHPHPARAAQILADLYDAWEKPEDAARWREAAASDAD